MRRILNNNTYKGIFLGEYDKNSQGYYLEILEKIEAIYRQMIESHSQVFVITFQINFPDGSNAGYQGNNELIRRLTDALKVDCKRKGFDPGYIWVREMSSYGNVHYHLTILLNGNLIQNGYGLVRKANTLWRSYFPDDCDGGNVHLRDHSEYDVRSGGVKIRRNDPNFDQVYAESFRSASYLAKVFSKGDAPTKVNEFGCSRLR